MLTCSDDQGDTIAFLSTPKTYGLRGTGVEIHETHGAIVFLAGDKAYKLKRALRLPYMDYSTVRRRREMCERELAVNLRTAPDIYLDVQPIVCGLDGQLAFGALDDPIILDWVVVMRRFEQNNLLEQMRKTSRLTADLIRQLAEIIAKFHETAGIRRDYGGTADAEVVIAGNIAVLTSLAGEPFDAAQIDRFSGRSQRMLDRVRPVLEKRREQGRVRHCHGDLHLNNICLFKGRPVLFDAIEFNDAFACIDVFYDLAFLLMDLDRHGLRNYANILLNRYLELTDDYEGLATLPLFLSFRAAIRAHVAATTGALVMSQSEAKLEEAGNLFDRAAAYLEPAEPRLVAIGGVSGTGKSTLARNLAAMLGPAPGALVLRSDVLRKHLMGVDELTTLPSSAYEPEINRKVYTTIAELSAKILSAGHAVVTDAVYGAEWEREQIGQVAVDSHVRFNGLWLEADPELLRQRIAARVGDASDATINVLRQQLAFVQNPKNWIPIDASAAPAEIADKARGILRV